MALLLTDQVTVGVFPLPDTALRLTNPNSLVNKIPAGFYEFKPVVPPVVESVKKILDTIGIKPEAPPIYISPYDVFELPVTAIPTFPNEYITNMTIVGPIACFLEDPLPSLKFPDALRSLEQAVRIGISPWWAPGLFFEPFVTTIPVTPPVIPSPVTAAPGFVGTGPGYTAFTSKIGGYYTERNWTDREWILKERDVIAKYNINGRFYKPWDPENQEYPIDVMSINQPSASLITPFTFYGTNILSSATIEEVMLPYIRCAEHVMSYKGSEIRSMRFYFTVVIDSVIYPPYLIPQPPPASIILKTPFIAHMSVDTNHDWMSIVKILTANTLASGPCRKNAIYDNLDIIPPSEGTEELKGECFTTQKDTEEYIQELEDDFSKFIEDNTIEQ